MLNSDDETSLIEYPNLPAPYKTTCVYIGHDVLPYTSEFSVCKVDLSL